MALPPQQAALPAPTVAPTQLGSDPAAIYRALRDQREVLGEQRQNIESQREELQQQYDQMSSGNPGRDGVTRRIQALDARLQDIDGQIAKSDAAVATQAAIPGATIQPPDPPQDENVDMDMVVGLSFVVVMVFAIPIAIAYARRIWRRSAKTEVTLPPQLGERMESLERGMEAVALEVERIGEGQRFMTQALAERLEIRSIGAGAAQSVGVKQGERSEQRR